MKINSIFALVLTVSFFLVSSQVTQDINGKTLIDGEDIFAEIQKLRDEMKLLGSRVDYFSATVSSEIALGSSMTAIPSATLTLSVSADSDVRINVMMLVNRGAAMAGNIQLTQNGVMVQEIKISSTWFYMKPISFTHIAHLSRGTYTFALHGSSSNTLNVKEGTQITALALTSSLGTVSEQSALKTEVANIPNDNSLTNVLTKDLRITEESAVFIDSTIHVRNDAGEIFEAELTINDVPLMKTMGKMGQYSTFPVTMSTAKTLVAGTHTMKVNVRGQHTGLMVTNEPRWISFLAIPTAAGASANASYVDSTTSVSNCYTQTDIEASKKGVLFVSGFTTLEAISTSAEWDWFKNRIDGVDDAASAVYYQSNIAGVWQMSSSRMEEVEAGSHSVQFCKVNGDTRQITVGSDKGWSDYGHSAVFVPYY